MTLIKETYRLQKPTGPRLPIVISVPHCGAEFPSEVRQDFLPKVVDFPDDTDWFVDQLYDYAPAMGITLLAARICRYVIDLNRDPDNLPLYDDGRVVTELVPTRTFLDQPVERFLSWVPRRFGST